MRKIALFLSLCVFIWASDLQQALEYEKQDFSSRLALANYLGENESFNPLGISSYKMNYFYLWLIALIL